MRLWRKAQRGCMPRCDMVLLLLASTSVVFAASLLLSVGHVSASGQVPSSSSEDCGSPLLRAIYGRNLPEIRRIIATGENIDFQCRNERITPLLESIAEGLPEIAKELLQAGANPNLAAADGTTPLIQASWYCQEEVVSLLLERGATVDTADELGETPLVSAAQNCADGRIVDRLLKAGAKLGMQTKNGDTALMVATFYGNERAVRVLVGAGADIRVKNKQGETALTIAKNRTVGRMRAHDRIYLFLRDHVQRRP